MIDAASHRGEDVLPGGTVLQPEDIQAALDWQGTSLEAGDAVLIRTGWARFWQEPVVYMSSAPGLSRRSAEWLADQGCVALGADQWMIDALPPERPEDRRACHEVCLVERGIQIIENLNLEQLASERVYAFLFVALAPPLKGGTAFPCQAVAVV
jgi:kynurenine formamidase